MYFFSFGRGFWGFFSMLFPKAQASCGKNLWNNFSWIVLLFEKVCFRILKFYFKLEILIFLYFVVSFSVDIFNWKDPFLTKKTSVVKSETRFRREATENERGKELKENSVIGSWSSAKLFVMQNYFESANGDVPLTIEIMRYF